MLRKDTKVHMYVQCLAFLSKPERTYLEFDKLTVDLGRLPHYV